MQDLHVLFNDDGFVLGDANFYNIPTYTESSNSSSQQVILGSVIAPTLEFEVENLEGTIDNIEGKEAYYIVRRPASQKSYKTFVESVQPDAMIIFSTTAFVAVGTSLNAYNVNSGEALSTAVDTGINVESIILNRSGFKLYCLTSEAPYIKAYTYNYSTHVFTAQDSPVLDALQTENIIRCAKSGYSYQYLGSLLNIISRIKIKRYNGLPSDAIETTYQSSAVSNRFVFDKPEKVNTTRYKVTALGADYKKLMGSADDFLSAVKAGSYTTAQIFKNMMSYVGITSYTYTSTVLNQTFIPKNLFTVTGLTYLDVLKYLGEIGGVFWRFNWNGIEAAWYSSTTLAVSYDKSDYTSLTTADYETQKIIGVQIKSTDADIGVTSMLTGEEGGVYVIQGNIFLFTDSESEITAISASLLGRLSSFHYRPFSMTVTQPLVGVRAGDLLSLDNSKNIRYNVYVMNRTVGATETLSAEGEFELTNDIPQYTKSIAMGGKYYELEQSIDGLTIQVGNIESQLDLSVTAEKMTAAITTAAGGQTVAVFDADGITTYNGGFRIRIGTELQYKEIFSVSDDGNIYAVGTFVSDRTDSSGNVRRLTLGAGELLYTTPSGLAFALIPSDDITNILGLNSLKVSANETLELSSGNNNLVFSWGDSRYRISVENGFVKGTLIS